ncbi:MAG: hypothetical protein ACSLEN_08335 [Candidatus Malihini olakiniferum]
MKKLPIHIQLSILDGWYHDVVKNAIYSPKFQEYFFANSKNAELTSFIKSLLA